MVCGRWQMMGDIFSALAAAVGAADKVVSLIQREPGIPAPGRLQPPEFAGRIQLDSVVFSYPARPHVSVLNGLSLTINPGEVGPSTPFALSSPISALSPLSSSSPIRALLSALSPLLLAPSYLRSLLSYLRSLLSTLPLSVFLPDARFLLETFHVELAQVYGCNSWPPPEFVATTANSSAYTLGLRGLQTTRALSVPLPQYGALVPSIAEESRAAGYARRSRPTF